MNLITIEKKFDYLFVLGDPHQEWVNLTKLLRKFDIKNAAIIGLGDFPRGLGDKTYNVKEEERLENFNRGLKLRNCSMWNIRGNHDNPSFFDGTHDYSNIFFIPDYTILELNEKRIFCLGGAISIDRKKNVKDIDWFEDEGIVIKKDELKNIIDIDIMITHTSPTNTPPLAFNQIVDVFAENDPTLKEELAIERHLLRQFYDKIKKQNPKLKEYYYGHFHYDSVFYEEDIKFIMVSIFNLIEIKC